MAPTARSPAPPAPMARPQPDPSVALAVPVEVTVGPAAHPSAQPGAAAAGSAGRAGRARVVTTRRWRWDRVAPMVRYASVSMVRTAMGLSVLGTLVATRTVTPGWANVVATGVGTVPSFELNRRWVWGRRGNRSATHEVGPFVALSFAGLALSTAAVSVAGHLAAGLATPERTGLVEAANVGAFGSLWVLQFLLLDRVLFAAARPAAISARGRA